MNQAFIALGSNLQQPQQQVTTALRELAELPQTTLLNQSSFYRTAPVGYDNQPEFINAVAQLQTMLQPLQLLHAIQGIENLHGRKRSFPNAPRVLDLDLLLYNNMVMDTTELTLPHPRMHERGFVLLPLAEIAPDLALPQHGNITKLAQTCQDQGVKRITA